MSGRIACEVRALEGLDLEGVRAEWRRRYGAPPALRSPDLMRRMLAWRIQVAALGGLDPADRRRLKASGGRVTLGPRLAPGSRLTREWDGRRHEVEAVERGFLYNGEVHRSLSTVARIITGVQWNGPRFFGLRKP